MTRSAPLFVAVLAFTAIACNRDVRDYAIRNQDTLLAEINEREGLTIAETFLLQSRVARAQFDTSLGAPPSLNGKTVREAVEEQRQFEAKADQWWQTRSNERVAAALEPFGDVAAATLVWLARMDLPNASKFQAENIRFMRAAIGLNIGRIEAVTKGWSKDPNLFGLYEAGTNIVDLRCNLIILNTELGEHAFPQDGVGSDEAVVLEARDIMQEGDGLRSRLGSIQTDFDVAATMALQRAEWALDAYRKGDPRITSSSVK